MTNEDYMDYEDYYARYDRWYSIAEMMHELRNKFIDSLDKDDMDYPPCEYWESGVA